MPYNFAADTFHTKKLCRSSNEVHFLMKIGRFAFFEAHFGGLRGNVRLSS